MIISGDYVILDTIEVNVYEKRNNSDLYRS